jgi:hypothetical protein
MGREACSLVLDKVLKLLLLGCGMRMSKTADGRGLSLSGVNLDLDPGDYRFGLLILEFAYRCRSMLAAQSHSNLVG